MLQSIKKRKEKQMYYNPDEMTEDEINKLVTDNIKIIQICCNDILFAWTDKVQVLLDLRLLLTFVEEIKTTFDIYYGIYMSDRKIVFKKNETLLIWCKEIRNCIFIVKKYVRLQLVQEHISHIDRVQDYKEHAACIIAIMAPYFTSYCYTFKDCINELNEWSQNELIKMDRDMQTINIMIQRLTDDIKSLRQI